MDETLDNSTHYVPMAKICFSLRGGLYQSETWKIFFATTFHKFLNESFEIFQFVTGLN